MKHEISIQYIAGLIDGEGSFSYIMSHRPNKTVCYSPVIAVANQHKGVLLQMMEFFGVGHVSGPRDRSKCYYYQVRVISDVMYVIRTVAPYLIIKQKRARDLIKVCEQRTIDLEKSYNCPYSQEFVSMVEQYRGDI